jgi:fatty acyl-CoA reductase
MFKRINEDQPEVLKKIVPVFGDITHPSFGLSDDQLLSVIQQSEIVFHMAASLKLEATLKPNIEMNLMGTKYAIDICKKMPKLLIMIHLSTAFCTCDETNILYERVYDWQHDPKELIRCAEWMDEKTMELITPKLLGPHPNTYTVKIKTNKGLKLIRVLNQFSERLKIILVYKETVRSFG